MIGTPASSRDIGISDRGAAAYSAGLLPWLYEQAGTFLQPDEQTLMERFGEVIRGGRVLDIGVGAGRTTAFLAPMAGSYLGIDYSPRMVTLARHRCANARIEEADARDLSRHPAACFDFVLFSNCGIDSLDPGDRLRILAEVRRVLAPGGRFAFATHNRAFLPLPPPWSLSHLTEATSLRNLLRRILIWPIGIVNWLRYYRPPVEGPDHVVVHDVGEGLYNYFTVYTTAVQQRHALEGAGFRLVALIDMKGKITTEAAIDAGREVWFTCVAEPA